MSVVRFSVSLEKEVLEELDKYISQNSFPNRSQAISRLITNYLVTEKWEGDEEVAGNLTIVYDHHKRNLLNQLTHIQHDYHHIILSNLHFHIDHHNCMEIIALKGKSGLLKELSEKIMALKGIQHGSLSMTK